MAAGGHAAQVIHADWTWTGGKLVRGLAVSIADDGTIASVAPSSGPSTLRLGEKAIIPGFVSAHSHAFQRGLRGMAERFGCDGGEFFSWRDAMYALVRELTPERCHALSRQAFQEMLDAGITTVGEFHYVRHLSDGEGDEGRYALDDAVLSAARDVGIRIVLLHACYMSGGFGAGGAGAPLVGGQLRFRTRDEREYWEVFDRLVARCDGRMQRVAATGHSLRAVPIDVLARLRAEATRRGSVFHLHLEEVAREVDECVANYGKRPAQLVLDQLAPDETLTVVHATHTIGEDLTRFASAGTTVCLCPITEGNLGDGICELADFTAPGGNVAFGTDLNSRIAPTEELRWLEYAQRLHRWIRGAVVAGSGSSGEALLTIGTRNGARSLGIESGEIAPGRLADFAVVDLRHPTMAGWTPETFADHLIFGTGTSAVSGTCVGGRWRMRRP